MSETFEQDELFRFKEIAFDVAQIFGVTTDQARTRAARCLNRAMIDLAGHDRRWSWLRVKTSFDTVASTREYSLNQDVKIISQMWMQGTNRQRIDRIPTGQFVERVPNPDLATGIPRLYDEEGVDSSGAKIISLYPVPASALEIFYRYTRHINPIRNDSVDVRSYWGLPANLLEALTQKAAAMMVQGVNSERYLSLTKSSKDLIDEAYTADQNRPQTTYRAPMHGEPERFSGPQLPPEFGYE